ncbi:MAG: S53 family peptidase [Bryobacteraceae bacterium]
MALIARLGAFLGQLGRSASKFNYFNYGEKMISKRLFLSLSLAVGSLVAGSILRAAQPAVGGQLIGNNTPRFVSMAKNLGPEDPSKIIDVTIWLNLHNRGELDSLTEELYDPASPRYHDWLTRSDFAAKFAPTAEEAKTIQEFFESHKLPIVAVGPDNRFVRARGAIADVAKAFQLQINRFDLNGKTYRANTSDPLIEGPAASLVHSVSGLNDLTFEHPLKAPGVAKPGSGSGFENAASGPDPDFFTSNCFTGVKTEQYTGTDPFGLSFTATYKGNSYNGTENAPGCGYTPPEIHTAYNLTGLYKEGFDGTGQTIVIIDWCGSETIQDDANTFSARFGLPALTSSNFHIIYPSTYPTCMGPNVEISIDVEWAHAIAPGAKIDLLVPPTALFQDIDIAELYAIANHLGNVISGSYGSPESETPAAELEEENLINQTAAALGISANFASGDDGDFTPFGLPATVLAPADSPNATAVGGVSLALNSDNTMFWQTGWGNNETLLVSEGYVYDPPINFGFYAGSGGGPSAVFAKPMFQKNLPGTQRQLPDISWLADPFTGAVIVTSYPFQFPPQEWQVYGGTSVATPMFSALWAIANQEAGAPLGLAAKHLYSMPAGTITDVLPISSPTNVTATFVDPFSGTTTYTAAELVAPLYGTTKFYSALWNIPLEQDTAYVLSFGTDSGLKTTVGWDNVTGLGTPNGRAFADHFNPARPVSK